MIREETGRGSGCKLNGLGAAFDLMNDSAREKSRNWMHVERI